MKSEREVAQSCPTLRDSMDCSLPGSSALGIFPGKYWSGLSLPSQCSCLENPRDGGAWWAACLWGRTESDMTEAT